MFNYSNLCFKALIHCSCLLAISAFAEDAAATKKSPSSNTPWPSKLRVFAGGATKGRGIFTIDYLMPLCYSKDRSTLFFFNPKEHFSAPYSEETNLGLGLRTIFKDKFILGINYFHDIQNSVHRKWYHQNGAGMEFLSKPFDFRFNYYKPSTHAKQISDTTYELGNTNLLSIHNMEEPLKGLDFEVGGPFFYRYLKTRAYLGGFFYDSKLSHDLHGLRFRSETYFTKWIALDSILECPNHGKVNFTLGLRFTIPIYFGKRSRGSSDLPYIQDRLFERVVRDIDIQGSASTQKISDPGINIIYVDNTSQAANPDGTLANPYPTLLQAFTSGRYLANGGNANYIYLFKGDGTDTGYTGHIELADNITLWGSGYNGGYKGIAAPGYPIINADNEWLGIVMGSNSTVMGIELRNSSISGIHVANVSDVSIHHNIVNTTEQYIDLADGAISVLADTANVSNIHIYNNLCTNNATTAGIFVLGFSNIYSIQNVVIENNTVTLNSGGIVLNHFEKGNTNNITIRSNIVTNNGIGILAQFPVSVINSSMSNISIINNTVSGNVDGVAIVNNSATSLIQTVNIARNSIINNSHLGGVYLQAGNGQLLDLTLDSNEITGNTAEGGINILNGGTGIISLKAYSNTITDNTQKGILIAEDEATGSITADFGKGNYNSVGYNSIHGSGSDDFSNAASSIALKAEYNWWGQSSGPDLSKITGLTASDYTPWLTSDPNQFFR